jgi:hypothetical protein
MRLFTDCFDEHNFPEETISAPYAIHGPECEADFSSGTTRLDTSSNFDLKMAALEIW